MRMMRKKNFWKGLCVGAGLMLGMNGLALAAEKDANGYYIGDVTAPWGRLQIVGATDNGNVNFVAGKTIEVQIFAEDDYSPANQIWYAISTTPFSDTEKISSWEVYSTGKTVEVTLLNDNGVNAIYLALKDLNGNISKVYDSSLSQTVTYNLNGANATMGSGHATTRFHGTPFVVTNETPRRDGYYFLGWGLNAGDTTPSYRQGDIIPAAVTIGSDTNATLYAIWTTNISDLPKLADVVSVGDYVDYPVYYENVATYNNDYIAKRRGWRVLSKDVDIDGNASPGTVNLVSAGVPLTYYHHLNSETSIKKLTMDFLNIPFSVLESDKYVFRATGFNPVQSLTQIFNNKYTDTYDADTPVSYSSTYNDGTEVTYSGTKGNGTLKVRSITKEDLDKIYDPTGETVTAQGTYVNAAKYQDLLAVPANTQNCVYRLASAYSSAELTLVYSDGNVGYGSGYVLGVRPVVSLKTDVRANGTDTIGAWDIEIVDNSVTAKLKVGDYVNYSANGIDSWRVFDIVDGEVLITPANGAVGSLALSGVDGYANAGSKIEAACDAYANSSLGITASNVRSMTVEDINRVAGYTPEASTTKYAYFLNSDSTYDSATVESGYTKEKHSASLSEGWTTPRFYTWDNVGNPATAYDEINKVYYAYPTEGNPVYVTSTIYSYSLSDKTHVNNSDVNVGDLLGSSCGWLASPCVGMPYSTHVRYCIRITDSSNVSAYLTVRSDGYFADLSHGVRPLVSLGSGLLATRDDESSPWELSIDNDSILSKAKVGDYVNYSANGIDSWRVFDIVDGEVLITPANGPTTETLTLSGVDGYVNGISDIEAACDAYTNSSLGITASNVRSMTVEDINRIAGYTPAASTTKHAYFLSSDSTYSSATVTSGYTKVKHTATLNNGWTTPRFYTWDSAANVATDENGNEYAYPTEGNPVYVTHTYYNYNASSYNHVSNSSITVGSLLGSSYGWLVSPCVYLYLDSACFGVGVAYSDYVAAYLIVDSYGNTNSPSCGVRPLVSLGSAIKATRANESSPWVLSK